MIRKVTHENFCKFMNIEFEFIKLFDRFMYPRFEKWKSYTNREIWKMYNIFYIKCVQL